jgi:hypothetical protein
MKLFDFRLVAALACFVTGTLATGNAWAFDLWEEEPGAALNYPVAGAGTGCEDLDQPKLDLGLWPEGPDVATAMPEGCLEAVVDGASEDSLPR